MILRRIIAHFRKQEWTAIAIDFLIVVTGVFVGLQVNNWNEARALNAEEHSYLAQLRDEIAEIRTTIGYQTRFVGTIISGGQRALAYLDSGADCERDCEALLIDFFHASQVWGTGYSVSKFQEVQRLGFPRNEETLAAVQPFYLFLFGWDVVIGEPPAYRERVRGYFNPEASRALWKDCYRIHEGRYELLSADCLEALRSVDVRSMLREIGADKELKHDLQYWIGQNIYALQHYPDLEQRADAAIAAINLELGEAP